MLNRFYMLLCALLLCQPLLAQQDSIARIGVRSRIQKNAILLRWAASTPMAWKQSNNYGVRIERYTVVRNGEILPLAEKKVLAENLKAQPLEKWEAIVQTDDYAAIIAQALYGEKFELTGADAQGIARIIHLSQELEQRFNMALYSADQSFIAASMAGWAWTDNDVKPGERYLYRIIPNLPDNPPYPIEMGAAYATIDEYEELPKPQGLTAVWGDQSVMLTWDYGMLRDVYNSYYIEKSTDGQYFSRMDGAPVTNINNKDEGPAQRMYYIDSLKNNTIRYHYRVIGTTAFGEAGPPSDTLTGKGRDLLIYVPHITRAVVNEKGEMEMEWEFDERGNALIKGFTLNRSDDASKGYAPVMQNILPAKRSLTFDKLSASNYFTITAMPHQGEAAVSPSVLVQPVDSIPPAIPKGLKGSIDSTGVVTLTWNRNTEPDMLGYKVFRGMVKGEELMPLFDIALRDTVYRDTIDVKNLNRRVYYSISAADMRYNQSDLSPVLELEKPDMVPPSSPVISDYRIADSGIEVQWLNSPDEGVTAHRVYRREKENGNNPRVLLATISNATLTSYTDTSAGTNVRYIYTVTAVKKSGLESSPSNALTAFTNKLKKQQLTINRFDAVVDKPHRMLKLTWQDKLANVQYYEIYKGDDATAPSLWKTIPAGQREILDEGLQVNVTYRYLLRAILKDGKNTGTKELVIKY